MSPLSTTRDADCGTPSPASPPAVIVIAVAISSRRKVGIADEPPSDPTEPGVAIEETRPTAQGQAQRQSVEREPETT